MASTVIDEEVLDDDQQQECRKAMAISQLSGVLGVAQYDFESQLVCLQLFGCVWGYPVSFALAVLTQSLSPSTTISSITYSLPRGNFYSCSFNWSRFERQVVETA